MNMFQIVATALFAMASLFVACYAAGMLKWPIDQQGEEE